MSYDCVQQKHTQREGGTLQTPDGIRLVFTYPFTIVITLFITLKIVKQYSQN